MTRNEFFKKIATFTELTRELIHERVVGDPNDSDYPCSEFGMSDALILIIGNITHCNMNEMEVTMKVLGKVEN